MILKGAQSSIHEIEGGILLLMSVIAFGFAAIVRAVNNLEKHFKGKTETPAKEAANPFLPNKSQ